MEEATESETQLLEAMTDLLDEFDPTMEEVLKVLTYLLAAVAYQASEENEYPEDLMSLLHSAYTYSREFSVSNNTLN